MPKKDQGDVERIKEKKRGLKKIKGVERDFFFSCAGNPFWKRIKPYIAAF
jgi:hypothetical protein